MSALAGRTAAAAFALGLVSCHHTSPSPSSTTLAFTVSPIPVANIEFIQPLGNLNPPGHTFPTDHIYFYHHLQTAHRTLPPFEVLAPGDGTLVSVRREADDSIEVQAGSTLTYRVGHLILDAGIVQNGRVTAGQRLGVTSGLAFALDLGVINSDVTLGFISPARYSTTSLHCDKPLRFYSGDLKNTLDGLVAGVNADKDGRIDYDQPGRLAGNWFHETLTVAESPNVESGPRHLAFVRQPEDTSKVRISIGGTVAPAGSYSISGGDPDPADVTTASGSVTFNIVGLGAMTVQMLSDNRIRVDFGGAGNFYVR